MMFKRAREGDARRRGPNFWSRLHSNSTADWLTNGNTTPIVLKNSLKGPDNLGMEGMLVVRHCRLSLVFLVFGAIVS